MKTSAIAMLAALILPILLIAIVLAGFTETLLPKNLVQNRLSESAGLRGISSAGGLTLIVMNYARTD